MAHTISKAEQKRIADTKSFILSNLKRVSKQMKNDLLEAVGKWAVSSVELKILNEKEKTMTDDVAYTIRLLETRLEKSTLLSLDAMKEEEINFDTKIERVAEKMVAFGLTNRFFRVKELKAKPGEFEFLAHNDTFEVHARAIYVNGAIKAPHYRFITTKRALTV